MFLLDARRQSESVIERFTQLSEFMLETTAHHADFMIVMHDVPQNPPKGAKFQFLRVRRLGRFWDWLLQPFFLRLAINKINPSAAVVRGLMPGPLMFPCFVRRSFALITEHHSLELNESGASRTGMRSFGFTTAYKLFKNTTNMVTDGKIAVTPEIARNESFRGATAVIQNATALTQATPFPLTKKDPDSLIIVFSATRPSAWHGLDRLWRSITSWLVEDPDLSVEVLLWVPPGSNLSNPPSHPNLNLVEVRDKEEFSRLARDAHFSIGSLGMHRLGMEESSNLKTRDYLAMGLPVVQSGIDPGLVGSSWVFQATADDENIPLVAVRRFLQELHERPRKSEADLAATLEKLNPQLRAQEVIAFALGERIKHSRPVRRISH